MIKVFKMTHGLHDDAVTNDFLFMKPSRARGHDFNIYKLGWRLDVRKYSFRVRVTSQWNNLPDSVENDDSMNSFKNCIDKFWNDSVKLCKTQRLISMTWPPHTAVDAHTMLLQMKTPIWCRRPRGLESETTIHDYVCRYVCMSIAIPLQG